MVVMLDYADRLPRSAHMFSMEFAHLNSAFNPLLYAIFNPAFQRGYMLVFRIVFRQKEDPNRKRSNTANVLTNHMGGDGKQKVTSIHTHHLPSHMSIPQESIHKL